MKQQTFSDIEYSNRRKKTRREEFLDSMDEMIPWDHWVSIIRPYYPSGKRGRPPKNIEAMLRMYLMQNWFSLSDEGFEDAIYDSYAMRSFMHLDFLTEQVPDATTLLHFRHLMEENRIGTANAFAYTDSCTGAFIDSLALSPRWGRTLIVLIPDHYGCYPKGLDERSRHHIPLIMTGGALALRGKIDTPAAQSDLAATLLAALGLDAGDFPFSRDILATPSPQLSMFSEPDFAAAIAPDGTMTRLALTGAPLPDDSSSRRLAAYLQNLYTYLSKLSSPSVK